MPSRYHEILVELFRQRPALAPQLLRSCARIRLPGTNPELTSNDLTQVMPAEYRADSIVVLRGKQGKAVAAVIVEVQLKVDVDKLLTWPVYVAVARAKLDCPVMLLVVAPVRAVARWAKRKIELGHPGYTLRPIVIGFPRIPRNPSMAQSRAIPELAVLSAIAHPEEVTARRALVAIDRLPEDYQKLYGDIIMARLPALVRRTVERSMIKDYVYQSRFARKYYSEGERVGREEGLRRAIIEVVCARMPGLRDELESRLRDQPEPLLAQVAAQMGKARREGGVRTMLDRVLGTEKPPRRRRAIDTVSAARATRQRGKRVRPAARARTRNAT